MKRRHILRGALVAAVAAGFGTGCGEPAPSGAPDLVDPGSPVPLPSPTPSMPAAPLSGLAARSEAVSTRPALAVPVRVTSSTTPVGLDRADIIYQEYAESDSLHLTAVFQSQDATKIGPVTEIRPTDVRSLGVLHPFVAYDGGPTGFVDQFTKAGLRGATPGRQATAFQGEYTSTSALYKLATADGPPPTSIFDYAVAGSPLAERDLSRAGELSVTVPGRPTQVWRYDEQSGSWRGSVGKTTLSASSVVVLTMPYRTLSVRKPSFRALPSAKVFGEGTGLVVSGPAAARARWRKPGQKLVCHVLDLDGNQIHPLPGRAWVVYAPATAKISVR